ncbi:LysR family transcriptional regulator [Acidovorax sp. SUPP1855]|uniref:LysR substrate-binding domain-containing protein n=1 Tax=Acidovorax sp. SUPP1855 TaxID=431774 RepID=UPI0023DE3E71|nr:LysR substrate-binding domain-containing protein [Acidovorax sp. SUPP1855]GKS87613.1 LysR family transcriptional regulator [Acidovorax sp. SUPP1855]
MSQIDRVLRSNLKLRHLQMLVALDQFRHVGRAADFLSVTQPAVSKTLAEIERMFGLPLFDRSTRGTEPTAAGASVVRFARSVLAGYDRTRDEIAAEASGARGRTSVGAMVAATPVLLAQAVEKLKARSRHTTVLIEEGDLTRLLPKLRLGELDLFVGRLEPGYASPDLETEALYDDPMVAVVRPGHPLATKRKPRWADIAGQPCVLPPPWASLRVKLEQQFFAHDLHPPADIVESASFLSQITFLHQRGAVAFMARTVARHFAEQGMLAVVKVPVEIELPPVGLIRMRGVEGTPVTQALVGCLREIKIRGT